MVAAKLSRLLISSSAHTIRADLEEDKALHMGAEGRLLAKAVFGMLAWLFETVRPKARPLLLKRVIIVACHHPRQLS